MLVYHATNNSMKKKNSPHSFFYSSAKIMPDRFLRLYIMLMNLELHSFGFYCMNIDAGVILKSVI